MVCSICGGSVLWMGPLSNLTHTECQKCGAMNSQLADENDGFYGPDEEPSEYCECGAQDCWGEEELASGKCAACGGLVEA